MTRNVKPNGIEIGTITKGTVSKITNFGAFVDLEGGGGGLVHISEVDNSFVKDIHDHLSEGQTVDVKVIGVKDDGKLTLSIKQTLEPRFERKPLRRNNNPAFEKMLKSYLKSSEQRLADIKRNRMSKRT